ncbi:hypothetical protein GW915_00345 [bacterium]|nr:hypothetical protein [bacterium]
MQNEDKALNEAVEIENDATATPAVTEKTTEDTDPSEDTPAGDVEDRPAETEEASKKGFSQRVRELNTRAKEAEAKAESLAAKLKSLTNPETPDYSQNQPKEEPLVQPGEEIDANELDQRLRAREQRILKQTDALIALRGKQQEAVGRINSEAQEVMRVHPELDPESDKFNKELSEAISEATEAYVMKNPYTASVKLFVEKMMRPYKGAVSKGVGEMTESVVKQVSEAALRPTAVREKEKPAGEKSIAELEKELGILQA